MELARRRSNVDKPEFSFGIKGHYRRWAKGRSGNCSHEQLPLFALCSSALQRGRVLYFCFGIFEIRGAEGTALVRGHAHPRGRGVGPEPSVVVVALVVRFLGAQLLAAPAARRRRARHVDAAHGELPGDPQEMEDDGSHQVDEDDEGDGQDHAVTRLEDRPADWVYVRDQILGQLLRIMGRVEACNQT